MKPKTDTKNNENSPESDSSHSPSNQKSGSLDLDNASSTSSSMSTVSQSTNAIDANQSKLEDMNVASANADVSKFADAVKDQSFKQAQTDGSLAILTSVINAQTVSAKLTAIGTRDAFSFENFDPSPDDTLSAPSVPFRICNEIPSLFHLSSLSNPSQDVNPLYSHISRFASDIPQIAEAVSIFNTTTQTVRVNFNSKINTIEVGDPNTISPGVVKIAEVNSPKVNRQPYVNLLESRLFYLISAYRASESVLYSIPEKISTEPVAGPTILHSTLSTSSHWKGDHPHIYYSAFGSVPPWYQNALVQLYADAPLVLGESGTVSHNNKKVFANIRSVTDQWSSAIATLNFQRLQRQQLRTEEYLNRIRANMLPGDDVIATSHQYDNVLSLLYSPTDQEWFTMMLLIMMNRSVRDALFKKILPQIEGTNRLTNYAITDVWRAPTRPSRAADQMHDTWLNVMSVGTEKTPYDLLALETYSDWFQFRLNFGALPTDDAAIIDIMNIMFFNVCFPRLAQQTAPDWGYRLSRLLDSYLPEAYAQWKREYGEIRYNGQIMDLMGRMITRDQSAQGYLYSLFDPNIQRRAGIPNELFRLLTSIRVVMTPEVNRVHLDRKQAARYPYFADDFSAHASWQNLPIDGYMDEPDTPWRRRVMQVITVARDLIQFRSTRAAGRNTIDKQTLSFITAFLDRIKNLCASAPITFQSTMYDLQNAMFNSFAFVYDGYDPNRPFNVPPNIVIAPTQDQEYSSGVVLQKSSVINLDPAVAFRFLLTLEGDIKRNILYTTKGDPNSSTALPQPEKAFNAISGHVLDDMAMSLMYKAREFGTAFQLVRWLTNPRDRENPLRDIAVELQPIMRMALWVPLVKRIFESFNLNFQDYFVDSVMPFSGVYDGRNLDTTLKILDPLTMRPAAEQPQGTMFGRSYHYTDACTTTILNLLAKPLMYDSSPILKNAIGGYVGKFFVDELQPAQLAIEDGWTIVTFDDVTLSTDPVKGGQAHTLHYTDNDVETIYSLPYDPRMPKFMLHVRTMSEIPEHFKMSLAKAIHNGSFALKVDRMRIGYTITDLPNRTTDYSILLTPDDIYAMLVIPDGSFLHQGFQTTQYACNFIQNAYTIPKYIQWVVSFTNVDKNLHAAVISSGPARLAQTVLPSRNELGFGLEGNEISRRNYDGVLKVEMNQVNWNNSYPAIGKELQQARLNIEYVPGQAMSMEAFERRPY